MSIFCGPGLPNVRVLTWTGPLTWKAVKACSDTAVCFADIAATLLRPGSWN
jgi:hypothetical protein